MDEGERGRLRKKYLSLGYGELTSAALLTAVAGALMPTLAAMAVALLCSVWVLVPAGMYWLLACGRLGARPMRRSSARVYATLRLLNWGALLLGLVAMVLLGWPDATNAVLSLLVWMFAVAEHVNYYVVRLSYPWSRWLREVPRWRTPRLMKDVRKAV